MRSSGQGPHREKLDWSRAPDWPIKFKDLFFWPAQILEKKILYSSSHAHPNFIQTVAIF